MSQQRGLFSSLKLIGMCALKRRKKRTPFNLIDRGFLRRSEMAFNAQECGADDADVACSDVNTEKTDGYEKDTSKHLFFLRQYNFGTGVAPLITLKHKNATLHL